MWKQRIKNDLAKYGFEVSEKTDTWVLHRNGLGEYRPRRTSLLQKRHLQTRLKFATFKNRGILEASYLIRLNEARAVWS